MKYILILLFIFIGIKVLPALLYIVLIGYALLSLFSLFRGPRYRTQQRYYQEDDNQQYQYQNKSQANTQQSNQAKDVIDVEYTVHDVDENGG